MRTAETKLEKAKEIKSGLSHNFIPGSIMWTQFFGFKIRQIVRYGYTVEMSLFCMNLNRKIMFIIVNKVY